MSFWEDYFKGALLVTIGFVIAYCFVFTSMLIKDRHNQRFNTLECIKSTGQFNQCEKAFQK